MNKNIPLISIIVPVYKVEKYLDTCVRSIVQQTYKNLEIILVDDESPDKSRDICDEWVKKDTRIKVIHKKNGGAASARNAGLDLASGEYIGFVDSDDYIDKDMYRCLLAELQKSPVKVACCRSVNVPENSSYCCETTSTYELNLLSSEETIEEIFSFKMGTSVWRRLFHKSLFEDLRFPEGEINEEFPLIVPLSVKSGGTIYVKKPLYYYRDRFDSVTGTLHQSLNTLRCVDKNLNLICEQLSEYGIHNIRNFPYFVARHSFYMLVSIVKNHKTLDSELGKLYKSYLRRAKENKLIFLHSKDTPLKEKVLFLMLITGLYKKFLDLWR